MNRRWVLAGLSALGGCSMLPNVPYEPRREWPLTLDRPSVLPPDTGGPVLLVRMMAAAPGLEARGLQWLRPDGSVHVDFYEQWAVPPAQAVEAALRQWLANSGRFAAVVGPGSRMPATLVLEPELTTLIADPQRHVARAAVALVLLGRRHDRDSVLLQQTIAAEAPLAETPLAETGVPAMVAAMRSALLRVLTETEKALGPHSIAARRESTRTERGPGGDGK